MITLETTDGNNPVGSDYATISGNNLDSRTSAAGTGCIFLIESAAIPHLNLGENSYHMYDQYFAKPFIWNAPTGAAGSTGNYNLDTRDFLNVYPSAVDGAEIMFSGCVQQISNGQFVQPLCQ
jgi:hypothetical protein